MCFINAPMYNITKCRTKTQTMGLDHSSLRKSVQVIYPHLFMAMQVSDQRMKKSTQCLCTVIYQKICSHPVNLWDWNWKHWKGRWLLILSRFNSNLKASRSNLKETIRSFKNKYRLCTKSSTPESKSSGNWKPTKSQTTRQAKNSKLCFRIWGPCQA